MHGDAGCRLLEFRFPEFASDDGHGKFGNGGNDTFFSEEWCRGDAKKRKCADCVFHVGSQFLYV